MEIKLTETQKKAIDKCKNLARSAISLPPRQGKSIIALNLVEDYVDDRILLVCPTNIRESWVKNNIRKFYPNIETHIIETGEQGKELSKDVKGVVISSPKMLEKILHVRFKAIIVDEIHLQKGSNAGEAFQTLKLVCDLAEKVVVLSGTLADHWAKDLYATFRILKHKYAYFEGKEKYKIKDREGGYFAFCKRFCDSGKQYNKFLGREVNTFKGCRNIPKMKEALEEIAYIDLNETFPHEIETFLVEIEQFDKETQTLYDNAFIDYQIEQEKQGIFKDLENARHIVERSQCKQIVSEWKAKKMCQTILDDPDEHIVAVVFSLDAQKLLKEMLIKGGKNAVIYKKHKSQEEWEKKGGVLILSPSSGGVGLELVKASKMYILDVETSPKTIKQIKGRVCGWTQKAEKVTIIETFMRNTIDEEAKKLQETKKEQLEDGLGV